MNEVGRTIGAAAGAITPAWLLGARTHGDPGTDRIATIRHDDGTVTMQIDEGFRPETLPSANPLGVADGVKHLRSVPVTTHLDDRRELLASIHDLVDELLPTRTFRIGKPLDPEEPLS